MTSSTTRTVTAGRPGQAAVLPDTFRVAVDEEWGDEAWAVLLAEPRSEAIGTAQAGLASRAVPAVGTPARRLGASRRPAGPRPAAGRPAPSGPAGLRAAGPQRRAARSAPGRSGRSAVATGRRRLRLTARGRLVLLVVLAVVGFAAFGLGRASAGSTDGGSSAPATVVVQPGDTLFGIAQRVSPGSDPRDVVDHIQAVNHLSGGTLEVGQVLRLR